MIDTLKQTLKAFRGKRIRLITSQNFTYIFDDFELIDERLLSFVDKHGHSVLISLVDIKKMEALS